MTENSLRHVFPPFLEPYICLYNKTKILSFMQVGIIVDLI